MSPVPGPINMTRYEAGDEMESHSSEPGSMVTVLETALDTARGGVLGFATRGEPAALAATPIVPGLQLTGVVFSTAEAATDYILLQTKGVFALQVKGQDSGGNAAIVAGAALYVQTANAVLDADVGGAIYGFALQGVASGVTSLIPVLLK